MTEEDKKKRDELLGLYLGLNEFESALPHRNIYTDDVIMGWIKATYKVGFGAGYEFLSDIVVDLECQLFHEREKSAKLVEALENILLDKEHNTYWLQSIAEKAVEAYRSRS